MISDVERVVRVSSQISSWSSAYYRWTFYWSSPWLIWFQSIEALLIIQRSWNFFFFQDVVSYQMTSSKMSQGACLDNNHTHFILVDDGTINKFGGEISFRASLENCISRKQMEKSCGKKRIIVILLFISVLVVVNPCPNSIVYVGRSMIDSGS